MADDSDDELAIINEFFIISEAATSIYTKYTIIHAVNDVNNNDVAI